MEQTFLKHKIGAWKLAGMFDGLHYAFVDDILDVDIKPSRHAKVVLNRIKSAYAMQFMFEKPEEPKRLNNRYME